MEISKKENDTQWQASLQTKEAEEDSENDAPWKTIKERMSNKGLLRLCHRCDDLCVVVVVVVVVLVLGGGGVVQTEQ